MLLGRRDGAPVVRWRGALLGQPRLLADLACVAEGLPGRRFAVNLCDDRYLFILGFLAALSRGQTSLLPASRAPAGVAAVRRDYPASYLITDADLLALLNDAGGEHFPPVGANRAVAARLADLDPDHSAALVFTSGSTGNPQPHQKSWRSLLLNARFAAQRFAVAANGSLVATVPPQHMYGLETSVMLPLVAGLCVDGGRPFYPADVCAALAALPGPRLLVTTPVHLRACVGADLSWPSLARVISATAPLDTELAAASERTLAAPLWEIYGCTEGGSLASRHTVAGARWLSYPGVRLRRTATGVVASGGHLDQPVSLSDRLLLHDAQLFELQGRPQDQLNIAGKRASLADLNLQLNALPGVEDGAFVLPQSPAESAAGRRLAALVVAPLRGERELLRELAERIDPAFLPRPLFKVTALPRNATGKLPQRQLQALLTRLRAERGPAAAGGSPVHNTELCIAADHPALAGHFPGNPLVPGVVLLDEVLALLNAWRGELRCRGLPQVKFLRPLRPGQVVAVRFYPTGVGQYRFVCEADAGVLAEGRLAVDGE